VIRDSPPFVSLSFFNSMRPIAYSTRGRNDEEPKTTLRQRNVRSSSSSSKRDDVPRNLAKRRLVSARDTRPSAKLSSSAVVARAATIKAGELAKMIKERVFTPSSTENGGTSSSSLAHRAPLAHEAMIRLRSVLQKNITGEYPQYFRDAAPPSRNLDIFESFLRKGFKELEVASGQCWTLPFRVKSAGDTLMWEFFVLNHDIDFRLTRRIMSFGGAFEVVVKDASILGAKGTVRGVHVVKDDDPCMYVFAFDNSRSWIRPKRIAYRITHIRKRTDGDASFISEDERRRLLQRRNLT